MCTDPRHRSDQLTEASNDHVEAVDRSDDESYVSHSHPDEAYADGGGFGYLVTRPIGGLLDAANVDLHQRSNLLGLIVCHATISARSQRRRDCKWYQ